jgi:hypothetical protein
MQDIGYQPREGPPLQLGTDSKSRLEHNLGNDNRVKGNFPDAEGTTRTAPVDSDALETRERNPPNCRHEARL